MTQETLLDRIKPTKLTKSMEQQPKGHKVANQEMHEMLLTVSPSH